MKRSYLIQKGDKKKKKVSKCYISIIINRKSIAIGMIPKKKKICQNCISEVMQLQIYYLTLILSRATSCLGLDQRMCYFCKRHIYLKPRKGHCYLARFLAHSPDLDLFLLGLQYVLWKEINLDFHIFSGVFISVHPSEQ